MRHPSQGIVLRYVVIAGMLAILVGCGAARGAAAPTPEEVQAALTKYYTEQYASEHEKSIWGAQSATVSVSGIKIGDPFMKQVLSGANAQSTYPVKAHVGSDVQYKSGPKHFDFGDKSDEVFFFYKDAFGEWAFKTGSM